ALMRLIETQAAEGQVVNIGGVEEVSIFDLAQRIKTLTRSRSEIRLIPYDEAYPKDFEDMQRRVPSTAKLRQLVDFAPSMRLEAILTDIYEASVERVVTPPAKTKDAETPKFPQSKSQNLETQPSPRLS